MRRTPLTVPQILSWADEHRQRTGNWPDGNSGPLPGLDEVWANIDQALREGRRGLPPGSSLARLLEQHRGYRNRKRLPRLSPGGIVKWADAWRRKHGTYPKRTSGPIPGLPGETWARVNDALVRGLRGLPAGSSLAQLLATWRGERNESALPRLTVPRILEWCDAHHRREGDWPRDRGGPVQDAPEETWLGVDMALRNGRRGLPAGSSLARLLARERGVRNEKALPRLTAAGIWAWMVSHHCRTGSWPTRLSGRVVGTRGETWRGVDGSLRRGRRGLPGGSSLQRLLMEKLLEQQARKCKERE